MIEHCQQILGEDPTSLFGGPPQRLNTEEKGSGTDTEEGLNAGVGSLFTKCHFGI